MGNNRNAWHRTQSGWTRSLGDRGTRVRLSQRETNGVFYRSVWIPGRGKSQASLGTRDRDEAERLGRALLAELRRSARPMPPSCLTLGELWRRYQAECGTFIDNKPCTRRGAAGRVKVLLAAFGEDLDVRTLTARYQVAYSARRLAGGIKLSDFQATGPVRACSVWMDLVLLHSMLTWATTVRGAAGSRLLDANPLAGVRREKEKNPLRPIASPERFQRTRLAMRELRREATSNREAHPESVTAKLEESRWTKMELALVLADSTGRRLGAVRQLRWPDADFVHNSIHWSAAADKKGKEWVVPTPTELADELKCFRTQIGTRSAWIFAGERIPEQPMDRHLFDKWLLVAEKRAGLPKLKGGLWHPYRRKWATERKHHALVDVAAAGGWKDVATLLTCYQQADTDAMLAVMSEPRKVREFAVTGTGE